MHRFAIAAYFYVTDVTSDSHQKRYFSQDGILNSLPVSLYGLLVSEMVLLGWILDYFTW